MTSDAGRRVRSYRGLCMGLFVDQIAYMVDWECSNVDRSIADDNCAERKEPQ